MIQIHHFWAYTQRTPYPTAETFTSIFIDAIFSMDRKWNHPKCSSRNERTMKMWYIYNMEYYLAINKNEIMKFSENYRIWNIH